MKYLKVFQTESDYNTAKDTLEYPTVSHIADSGENRFMVFPVLDYPIKAVFYDSSTGTFVKLYPEQITEVNPNYTPIGVEVVPAEHDVYGTGQAGIMSLAEMNRDTPDVGSSSTQTICWGGNGTDTPLPNYDVVNYIGSEGNLNNDIVQGTTEYAYLPSDRFSNVSGLDGHSNYYYNDSKKYAPSPYNTDSSRNEAYYTTTYSTANALSDFDGVGNTKVLTDLATGQSDWQTADTITNSSGAGYYPAACCAWRFHTAGTDQGQWYLPAMGELGYVINRFNAINTTINKVKSVYSSVVAATMVVSSNYWSSSEDSRGYTRILNTNNGSAGYVDKYISYYVRAFLRL